MRELKMSYYDVYYYCNIIDNLLHLFTENIDWAPTGAQFTEPFFEKEIANFPRYSALHEFCAFAVRVLIDEDAEQSLDIIQSRFDELENEGNKAKRLHKAFRFDDDHLDGKIDIDRILSKLKPDTQSFFDFLKKTDCSCISDDYWDFTFCNGDLEEAIEQLSRELFYILFQNREFLYRFNLYMARANLAQGYSSPIKRCSIPQWVKRAVKYRDRGKCVHCRSDLSSRFDCEDEGAVHFDHIVSLHDGGLNDVSNIQLTCRKCNLSKSGNSFTSTVYNDWYDFES